MYIGNGRRKILFIRIRSMSEKMKKILRVDVRETPIPVRRGFDGGVPGIGGIAQHLRGFEPVGRRNLPPFRSHLDHVSFLQEIDIRTLERLDLDLDLR